MRKTIWWSIQNGGDGSVYPIFFESEELATWNQEHLDDGWGEICSGPLEIESSGDIHIVGENVYSAFGFLASMWYDDYTSDIADEFIEAFFPNGIPEFDVFMQDDQAIFSVNGKVEFSCTWPEESEKHPRQSFLKYLER